MTCLRSFGWGMGFDVECSDGARPACLVVKCFSFFGFPPGPQHLRILIHDRRHLGFLIQVELSNLCSLLESCIAFDRPVRSSIGSAEAVQHLCDGRCEIRALRLENCQSAMI